MGIKKRNDIITFLLLKYISWMIEKGITLWLKKKSFYDFRELTKSEFGSEKRASLLIIKEKRENY